MLKPQEAINFVQRVKTTPHWAVYAQSLEYNEEKCGGWCWAVAHHDPRPGSVVSTSYFPYEGKIGDILNGHYGGTDRIDDMYVEDGEFFVVVNRGNVGSKTIEERFYV